MNRFSHLALKQTLISQKLSALFQKLYLIFKTMRSKVFFYLFAGLSLTLSSLYALDESQKDELYIRYLIPKIIGYSHQEDFIAHIMEMNHKHHYLSAQRLESLEEQWQEEHRYRSGALQNSVIDNPISEYLKEIEKNNKGLYCDLIALDNKGLVIGMTAISHQYIRSSEDKFTQPWSLGPAGSYVSPYLFSASVGKSLYYVSVTITDLSYEPIGVLVVGIDKDMMNRLLKGKIDTPSE